MNTGEMSLHCNVSSTNEIQSCYGLKINKKSKNMVKQWYNCRYKMCIYSLTLAVTSLTGLSADPRPLSPSRPLGVTA